MLKGQGEYMKPWIKPLAGYRGKPSDTVRGQSLSENEVWAEPIEAFII